RNPNSLSAPSGSGSYNSRKVPESGEIGQEGGCANYRIDEFGVDANSLYARMLGFTEDLVDLPAGSSIRNTVAGANKRGQNLGQSMSSEGGKNIGTDTKGGDKRTMSGAKKVHVPGNGSYGRPPSLRRKKSKPNAGLSLASSPSVSAIFEDMSPESAADAAEAICSALTSDNLSANAGIATTAIAKHSQGAIAARGRKKPASILGSVRRRRARLNNKGSNTSLNNQSYVPPQQQPSSDSALSISESKLTQRPLSSEDGGDSDSDAASSEAMEMNDNNDVCENDTPVSAIGLASSMQSLDL
ncbi:hypothetical protein GGI23_007417, partial [Coemansia sp. RSA 2559]